MTGTKVEMWDRFEMALEGPQEGNPFLEVTFGADFIYENRRVKVTGFYDGEGVYKVRFMPDMEGVWHYETWSNVPVLRGITGQLLCITPSSGNHGPVRVKDTYHFAYEDGTPYKQVGTTCYVWNHQGDALEEKTLETLKNAPFNKMRMCVFPKNYVYNHNEPEFYPFEGSLEKGWDFSRFNPAFFHHLERRIQDLMDLGIEADLILFHPYDRGRWGFDDMGPETDDRYLAYIVARLASFRNIWWSFANEYDLFKNKTTADFDRYFRIVQAADPYQHLRSNHNCREFYDHSKPWVTHCSIQWQPLCKLSEEVMAWRETYRKPVVLDEVGYEGDIERRWGNLSAQELLRRFWEGTVGGGYVGHGETYFDADEILWWSKGGELHGQSPERIAFLRRILEEGPESGLNPEVFDRDIFGCSRDHEYCLVYFGVHQPSFREWTLPDGMRFQADVIDTWEMTIAPVEGVLEGECRVDLPGKPYMALRLRRIE